MTSPSNPSPGEMLNACFTFLHRAGFTDPELRFLQALNDGQDKFGASFRFTSPQILRLTEIYTERLTPFL